MQPPKRATRSTARSATLKNRRPRAVPAAQLVDEGGLARPITDIPEDRNFIAALARGLAVLHAFSDRKRNMSIADVSHRTGIPRAAARRSLHTLERLGYLLEDDAHRYLLRPKVLTFSHAYLSGTPLALLAQPVLDRLSDRIHESSSLAVMEGDEIIYVVRSSSSRIMSPALNVGRRLPAYCTSIGRILVAHRPDADIDAYLSRAQIQAFTPHTVTSRAALARIFRAARQSGYATADDQMEPHFRTIAVPVRNTLGAVVAGINVIIPNERVSIEQMESRFVEPLRLAAQELSACLLP